MGLAKVQKHLFLLMSSNLTIANSTLLQYELWTFTQHLAVVLPLEASSEIKSFHLLELVGSSDFIG